MNFSTKCAIFLSLFFLVNINCAENLTQMQRHQMKNVISRHFKCLKDSEIMTIYCSILVRAMEGNEKVKNFCSVIHGIKENIKKAKNRLTKMQLPENVSKYSSDTIEDQRVKLDSLEKQYSIANDALCDMLLSIDICPTQQ